MCRVFSSFWPKLVQVLFQQDRALVLSNLKFFNVTVFLIKQIVCTFACLTLLLFILLASQIFEKRWRLTYMHLSIVLNFETFFILLKNTEILGVYFHSKHIKIMVQEYEFKWKKNITHHTNLCYITVLAFVFK